MERTKSRMPGRVIAGTLAAVLAAGSGGCANRGGSSAPSASPAAVASAPAQSGTIGSLAMPTAPAQDAPDTNPPMDPQLAAMFSDAAKAGGEVGAPVDPGTLTPTELQFGRAPKMGPDVSYQPDTIVMEHGDTALRSMDSNGIVWHFKAGAPQVDQLAVGKIVFATDRCVGRIGALTRNGDDVAVVLGPVQLTDVIAKGHFVYDRPLDVTQLVAVPVPDVPVAYSETTVGASPSPSATTTGERTIHVRLASVTYARVDERGRWHAFRRVTYAPDGRVHQHMLQRTVERVAQAAGPGGMPSGIPAPPPNIGPPAPPQVDVNGMKSSLCLKTCGGLGMEMEYEKNGLEIAAYSTFYLHNPSINFNVDIDRSGIVIAAISLGGTAGFKTEFTAHSNQSQVVNVHVTQPIPLDTILPINFIAPISIHLNSYILLSSGFSAKTGYLSGFVDFQMGRFIAVGYKRSGGWFADFPTIDVKTPYANVSGVSVGINSLIFGMNQRLLVGLGIAGFATGPYVSLTEDMSSLKQSSTTPIDCRMATMNLQLDAGVGWSIPAAVTKIVNIFLTLANAAPIPDHGSLISMDPKKMLVYRGSQPKGCAGDS